MNFIKTQDLLRQQIEQKAIPLDAVLDLIRTYLTELYHHTGSTVDECPIGDMSRVVTALAAVSNDILFVYDANKAAIEAEGSRTAQSLTKIQNKCWDYYNSIAQMDEQLKKEEALLKEQDALLEAEQNRNTELMQLQAIVSVKQAKIKSLSVEDPESETAKLKSKLADLNMGLERAEKEYIQIQQEYAGKKVELERKNSCLIQLREEYETAKTLWEKENKSGLALQAQLQEMREKTAGLKAEVASLKEKLERVCEEADRLIEEQVTLNTQLEARRTDNQNIRENQLAPTQEELDRLTDELKMLKASISEKETERSTIAQEIYLERVKLRSIEARLNASLSEYNEKKKIVEAMEADLRVKGAASEKLLAREQELRELLDEENIAKNNLALENCIQKLNEEISLARQTEQDLVDKQKELETLEQKLAVTVKQLEDCRSQEKALLDKYRLTEADLNRISEPENRERCERLYNQWLTMQAMRNKLTNGVIKPCGAAFYLPTELQKALSEAEKTLKDLRSVIQEYTLWRQNNLNGLG